MIALTSSARCQNLWLEHSVPFDRAAAQVHRLSHPARRLCNKNPPQSNIKWRRSSSTYSDGGGADDGGSGSGRGGGSNDDDGAGDDTPSDHLAVNAWLLFFVAAAALGLFGVHQRQKRLAAAEKDEQQRQDDVASLKRLLREVFAELVTVKSRLAQLEAEAGIDNDTMSDGVDASALGSATGHASASGSSSRGHKRTTLTGVWRLGGGLLWAQDSDRPHSVSSSPSGGAPSPTALGAMGTAAGGGGDALVTAGARLGTDLLLRLSRAVRGGNDSLHAEASVDPEAQRICVRRVLYRAALAPGLRLILAPFGGRGEDAAYTLNPLAGQGLAGFVRRGCPLHAATQGSLAAAVADGERAWGSAALFARGEPRKVGLERHNTCSFFTRWHAGHQPNTHPLCTLDAGGEGGGLATSLLAQVVAAPISTLSLGATYLQHNGASRLGGSEVASAAATPHPSPQRPMLLGALAASPGSVSEASSRSGTGAVSLGGPAGAARSACSPARQVAVLLAWKPDPDVVLHGWATVDATAAARGLRICSLSDAARGGEWGLVLGSMPDGSGNGWALGAGRLVGLNSGSSDSITSSSGDGSGLSNGVRGLAPNAAELSLQFNLGEGLLITPGLLLLRRDGGRPAAFVGVKSEWHW